jgi:hypothetical protein
MKFSPNPSWEITQEKAEAAIKKIIEVARPKKIILFGSYVKDRIICSSCQSLADPVCSSRLWTSDGRFMDRGTSVRRRTPHVSRDGCIIRLC